MSAPLGFVLLINPHNRLEQSARLINRLNTLFDSPPIAVHHDFGKNPKFIDDCPDNVRLVHPHVDTKWGDFTCIEATVRALRLLYSGAHRPDWFVFLSGSDYPVKPGHKIIANLQASPFDAHIQHLPLKWGKYPCWWQEMAFYRTCRTLFKLPWINYERRTSHPLLTWGRLPYSRKLRPYGGEAWFSANQRSAQIILDFFDTDHALAQHCRQIIVPEETYFHTILANAPGLKLSQDYVQYVDWSDEKNPLRPTRLHEITDFDHSSGCHPRTLTMADLPFILKSTAHFARKFDDQVDAALLDELDRVILER